MDPKPPADRVLLAPGAGVASVYELPGRSERRQPRRKEIPVDQRLVEPETRWEKIDGEAVYAFPAEAPHADSHAGLVYVVRAHVKRGFIGSADLLTRTDVGSDFATDASIRRAGKDPKTGGRYLEEIAFEVASTQTLGQLRTRAHKLMARGVRRIFAILVAEREVREWAAASGTWEQLAEDAEIRDTTLDKPLKVRSLIDAAAADGAVAEALWEKREPYLVEVAERTRAEGRAEGEARGFKKGKAQGLAEGRAKGFEKGKAQGLTEGEAKARAEMILEILGARGLEPPPPLRERVLACKDPETLKRWLARAVGARTLEDLTGLTEG